MERLEKSEDFQEYKKFLEAEINHFINLLVDSKTHPKDYITYRAEINARRGVLNTMGTLMARKPALQNKLKEVEEVAKSDNAWRNPCTNR